MACSCWEGCLPAASLALPRQWRASTCGAVQQGIHTRALPAPVADADAPTLLGTTQARSGCEVPEREKSATSKVEAAPQEARGVSVKEKGSRLATSPASSTFTTQGSSQGAVGRAASECSAASNRTGRSGLSGLSGRSGQSRTSKRSTHVAHSPAGGTHSRSHGQRDTEAGRSPGGSSSWSVAAPQPLPSSLCTRPGQGLAEREGHSGALARPASEAAALQDLAAEVLSAAGRLALRASIVLGREALLRGRETTLCLGQMAHELAVQSRPHLLEATESARRGVFAAALAAEAALRQADPFAGCLAVHREESESLFEEEETPCCQLPPDSAAALGAWTQPLGPLRQALAAPCPAPPGPEYAGACAAQGFVRSVAHAAAAGAGPLARPVPWAPTRSASFVVQTLPPGGLKVLGPRSASCSHGLRLAPA